MHILLCILPPAAPDYPLLGAAALVGAMRSAGHTCHLHDANITLYAGWPEEQWRWRSEGWNSWNDIHGHQDWAQSVAASICACVDTMDHVDGVALSSTSAGQFFAATAVDALARRHPRIPVILGGPGFFHACDIAAFTANTQTSICQGEGELAIMDWIATLRENPRSGPRIFSSRISSLDQLPFPDFSAFRQTGYTRPGVWPLETSRGCANRCAFCDDAQMWGAYRIKTPQRVSEEIRQCSEGATHISFCDSLLNPTPRRIHALAEHIAPHEVTWDGMLQCRGIEHDTAKLLRESGCTDVFLGVESLTQDILTLLNKASSAANAFTAIRALHESGIRVSMGLIVLGPPLQTRSQFEHDLHCLRDLAPYLNSVAINPLCIPQGTPLWASRDKLGIHWPKVSPWQFWHGGGGAADVAVRMSWCVEATDVLHDIGIKTGVDIQSASRQARRTVDEAWRCL